MDLAERMMKRLKILISPEEKKILEELVNKYKGNSKLSYGEVCRILIKALANLDIELSKVKDEETFYQHLIIAVHKKG
jgi:DNA-binding transcriptional ArsR family regulator